MVTEIQTPDAETPVADGNEAGSRQPDIRQFVIFIVADEVFAVDMSPVQEIIRVPEVVRVPMAPSSLEGLANLRGKVLPIVSLRHIFSFPQRAYDDATRAVVIDQGQALGFVVDKVSSVVAVDVAQIDSSEVISSTINTELVSGIIKDVGSYPMVMILDFARLIEREFQQIAASSASRLERSINDAGDAQTDNSVSDELQLVNFTVMSQEYAILIDDVQEIVQIPELVIHVPHSESHVLGVITLRNRLLPLVSLRRMFNLPDASSNEQCRIIVVALGEASVGVVVDSVDEVLRVARSNVDIMPDLLARDGDLSEIKQICRLDNGKRLVSVLEVANMFHHVAVKEALATVNSMDTQQTYETANTADRVDDEEQVVVFRLGKEEFGAPIDSVQEIVRVSEEMTHIPKAPAAVEGVVNLRGTVLPVIDLRRRLGMHHIERNDRQRIMVFLINGTRTGFIVDSVAEVLKIRKSKIEAAPHLSGEQSQLMSRIANLDLQKRMVQLIDPGCLVADGELSEIRQMLG